jgi:hypothetical protein
MAKHTLARSLPNWAPFAYAAALTLLLALVSGE